MDYNPCFSFIRSELRIDMPGFGSIQNAVMRKIFEEFDIKFECLRSSDPEVKII
ncbi:Uncharacterised protein [uncultured archaeon]|nr:Uncharacterised protein [uncultured archaeon]